MTDELLLYYSEAGQKRARELATAQFRTAVEGSRLGFVFAHDAGVYGAWSRDFDRAEGRLGLSGEALERAVMQFALANPSLVEFAS